MKLGQATNKGQKLAIKNRDTEYLIVRDDYLAEIHGEKNSYKVVTADEYIKDHDTGQFYSLKLEL